ncbi:MAG TPA: pyruvate kinase [Candidatus Methylacidiphilales bacterium]
MRRTKIIATLGPVSESPERLKEMMLAGVNIFRLNMSHAKHDWVRGLCSSIRKISAELGLHVGLLLDTQGPEIRTGDLPNKLNLKAGDRFVFTVRGEKREEHYSVDVNYNDMVDDISVGDVVLVDSGVIRMKVLEKDKNHLVCEVLNEGVMGSRRHINLPGVKVNLPALTEKDIADILLGIECGIDYVALSFVREAGDIKTLRKLLAEKNASHIRAVAKIEDQQAVKNLDAIIAEADGIMVARGDLGIECPFEELPLIQRRIVRTCIREMKPVIVATHMLESMIQNPIPTRAEITDVANAVFEQADCIMLSGETTVGAFPVESVKTLVSISTRTEESGTLEHQGTIVLKNDRHFVARSAVDLADRAGAAAICVFTRTGNLAEITAALRPKRSPIFAFAVEEALCNRLTLNYGVRAFVLPFPESPNETVVLAEKLLREKGLVKVGEKIVFISDIRLNDELISSVLLHDVR